MVDILPAVTIEDVEKQVNHGKPKCADCGGLLPPKNPDGISPGYARIGNGKRPRKICYKCCAERDKKWMRKHGRIDLYLTIADLSTAPSFNMWVRHRPGSYISNWPGTLRFPVSSIRRGYHNRARWQYHTHFAFEGYWWHGVQFGDNTQVIHCRRTKQEVNCGRL